MKEQQMRMTVQRRVILKELKNTKTHPTADELYGRVKKLLPGISIATVYRNLKILSESGIIGSVNSAGIQRHYDGNLEDHSHVQCVRCGCIDDIPCMPAKNIENIIRQTQGYDIMGHSLTLYGVCPQCRN